MTEGIRSERARFLLLMGPALLFLLLFFVIPVAVLFVVSFYGVDSFSNIVKGFTLAQYLKVFADPYFSTTLWETTAMSLEVTLFSLLLGYPAAYVLANSRSRTLRLLLYIVIVSPLLTSVVVRSYGWIVLLADNGLVNQALVGLGLTAQPLKFLWKYPAVLLSVTHVLLPYMILPLATAIGDIDPALKKASSSLGASRLETFLRVTLPLSIPGISAGTLLVFALAMGIYITPLLVGGSMQSLTAIRVYDQVMQLFNYPLGAALSFALVVTTLVLSFGLNLAFKRWERRIIG